MLLLLTT